MAKNKLRNFLDENPTVGLLAALIVLGGSLAAIAFFIFGNKQGGTVVDIWFYDVDAKQLFVAKSNDLPPIQAPSGGPGVKAYVFACNDCNDPDDRFIAWVEMYTPEYKDILLNPPPMDPENPDAGIDLSRIMDEGQLVAKPDSNKWTPSTSERAFALMSGLEERCNGQIPKTCLP